MGINSLAQRRRGETREALATLRRMRLMLRLCRLTPPLFLAVFMGFLPLLASTVCRAQTANATTSSHAGDPNVLRVGVFDAPPFSESVGIGADGAAQWTGSSLRLLERVARTLGVTVEYHSGSEAEILAALTAHTIDVCASPLAPTPERLGAFDFSYCYTAVGIGIAIHQTQSIGSDFRHVLTGLLAPTQSHLYVGIALSLLSFALLLWLVERRSNKDFQGHPWHGLGSSLWWSMVTLATVGYGDKVPRTVLGRVIASVWMLASVVVTAVFAATIVSAVTVGSLASIPVHHASDLARMRTAAVRGSISAAWLTSHDIRFTAVDSLAAGLTLLEQDTIEVLVAPQISLTMIARDHPEVAVAPTRFTDEFMCFGLSTALSPAFRARFDAALVDELPRAADSDPLRAAPPLQSSSESKRATPSAATNSSNAASTAPPTASGTTQP